ncbi:Uncharacterised protein [uncultured archaeon]|nr:Uncharacterised protein [uncultured archaeon]
MKMNMNTAKNTGKVLAISALAVYGVSQMTGCATNGDIARLNKKFDSLAVIVNTNTNTIEAVRNDVSDLQGKVEGIISNQSSMARQLNSMGFQINDLNDRFEANRAIINKIVKSISTEYGYTPDIVEAAVQQMVDSVSEVAVRKYKQLTPKYQPVADSVLKEAIQATLLGALTNTDSTGYDKEFDTGARVIVKNRKFTPVDIKPILDAFVAAKDYLASKYHIKAHAWYSYVNGYDSTGKQVKVKGKGEKGAKFGIDGHETKVIEKSVAVYLNMQVPADLKELYEMDAPAPAQQPQTNAIKGQ